MKNIEIKKLPQMLLFNMCEGQKKFSKNFFDGGRFKEKLWKL